VCVLRAAAAMLHGAFHWTKRLRPLAVFAAIPKHPRAVGSSGNGHGAAVGDANALRKRQAILKSFFRNVTGGAGNLAVGTETGIEEKLFAKFCGV